MTTKATSSITHQLQSSPRSAERKIGWPAACACFVACLFGEESQQPIFPHVMHMRRCTQRRRSRVSSQPAMCSGRSTISIRSVWVQTASPRKPRGSPGLARVSDQHQSSE